MKKTLTLLLCTLALQLSAQQETLFDNLEVLGAFGGPLIEIGAINGDVGADVGGGGALILNQLFLGGYGLGTDYPEYEIEDGADAGSYDIRFGHGGLWLGYTSQQHRLAHLFSSVKIGWGKARLREDGDDRFSDNVFVLTPEIGLELNLTKFFKMSLTGGYRWVNGINKLPGLANEDFSSPVGILTFRFGGFGGDWDDDDDW